MNLQQAITAANAVREALAPHCERIEIAGSIRRKRPICNDIDIVCIPKPYDTGLFESGIATVINKWEKVKGELPCKYTQRIHETGIKLEIYFAVPGNWGLIFAIRTGSADYAHKVLATGWVRKGYKSIDGWLWKVRYLDGGKFEKIKEIATPEEEDVFRIVGADYVLPKNREV